MDPRASMISPAHQPDWIEAVEGLLQLSEGWVDDRLRRDIRELKSKAQQEKFYLVMVGSFKRGKSSLINAMLGVQLAPVAVVPLTALITLFEYADEPFAEVHFLHQPPRRISLDEISAYVTEAGNPENTRQVAYVRIGYPSPLLRNMSIVDTPGIGSAFEHNTQTTLSFVPKIDAAVFVLSADTPISKADLGFLQTLNEQVPRICFVLNKADLLTEDELQAMLQYNRSQVAAVMGETTAMSWDVVSCKANETRYPASAFTHRLLQMVDKEKSHILQQSLRRQYRLLHNQVTMQLKLQKETLLMPVNELEEKQRQLQQALSLMQQQKAEFETLISSRIKYIQQQVDEAVQQTTRQWRTRLHKIYQEEKLHTWREMHSMGIRRYQEQQAHAIIQAFQEMKAALEQTTRAQFRELLETYASRSQSFLHELTHHLHALLGVDFHLIIEKFDLDVYTSFYFDYGKGLTVAYILPSMWTRWFPNRFTIGGYMKRLHAHAQQLLTINGSAIIYDLQYKIQESFRKFHYDLDQHLQQLLLRIQQIIADTLLRRAEQTSDIAGRIDAIDQRLQQLALWENI